MMIWLVYFTVAATSLLLRAQKGSQKSVSSSLLVRDSFDYVTGKLLSDTALVGPLLLYSPTVIIVEPTRFDIRSQPRRTKRDANRSDKLEKKRRKNKQQPQTDL